jgi:hypothetical protein
VTNAKESTFTVIPRGIDPTAVYRVTFDNHRATMLLGGYDLATNGIRVSLPSALSSELVLYERVEHAPPHKS